MKFFSRVRYLFALGGVIYTIVMMNIGEAQAALKKPTLMSGSADTSKADAATTKIVEYILYFGELASVIAIAISLVMCLPFIGAREKGISGLKGSIIVLLAILFVHALYAFIGSLAT